LFNKANTYSTIEIKKMELFSGTNIVPNLEVLSGTKGIHLLEITQDQARVLKI